MFESFVITLREGIEAALVVGIVLVFLHRTGRSALERFVFAGLGVAVVASVAAAALLQRLPINQEAWEGALMLLASAFVATTVIWMWRTARRMKEQIEGRLRAVTEADARRAGWGLFALTFLLVFREGAETVLLLAAVRLSSDGILALAGGVTGLLLAVFFGVALVKGSVRIDLGRFFRVTGIVLLIFALHLLAGALHEFAEAGMVPIGQRTMRVLGPIVKSQALVIGSMLALPLILFLVPGRGAPPRAIPAEGPERRLFLAAARRDRRWRTMAGIAGVLVVLSLTVSMARSRFPKEVDPPVMVTAGAGGQVRVPLDGLDDGALHRFGVEFGPAVVRFLVMQTGGEWKTAFDACQLCGAYGYVQDGPQIICLACAADINPSTVGAEGGCNPLPLRSRIEEGVLVVELADLQAHAGIFAAASARAAEPPSR